MNAEKIAAELCEIEADMLLDFCGLGTGQVCAGAAMWEIAKSFARRGLMTGWPGNAQPTALGREVAAFIFQQRRGATP